MTSTTLLIIITCLVCGGYLLDRVLDLLNLSRMSPQLPASVADFYPADKYERSQQYLREKSKFSLLGATLSFGLTLAVLLSGGLGLLDGWLRGFISHPFWLAAAFFAILALASDLLGTPFALYHTFVIEQKYGFNKTTWKTWLLDKVKGYLLGAVLGGLVLFAFVTLVDWLQEDFWIWFWVGISAFSLLLQYLSTTLLLPIFNKLTPLEAGPLRAAIEDYSHRVGFPLGNIMVMDGSKRSTKANAFFTGFGAQKRIVLYDTLIAQMSEQEILAVLAHEVGHYKHRHILQGTVIGLLNMGAILFILSRLMFATTLSAALGATEPGIHMSLVAFALLYSPISMLTGLAMNLLSRKNEYQADAFARTTYAGAPLESALIKLHTETLSNLNPHPGYVFVHYSHPPLVQRIAALRA